jgi:hypothetical protein
MPSSAFGTFSRAREKGELFASREQEKQARDRPL